MDLEKRVKSLEYEVNILKNEIQRTLLDIQEQVLTHYYPSLRQQESDPPEQVVQALEEVRAAREAHIAEAHRPVVKKVSLDEVRLVHGEPPLDAPATASALPANGNHPPLAGPPQTVQPPTPSVPPAGANVFQTTMVKLSDWVSSSAAQIGAERTSALLLTCASQNIIAPDMAKLLVRLAALHKEPGPDKVSVSEALTIMLRLYEMLGRPVNIEEVLSVIEETNLG